MDEPKNKRHDRFIALKYHDFRLLWLGQIISITGSQMQLVALNWHIYELTRSPVALGLIGLARFLPIIVFSLIGGNVADAHNRKKIMLTTQACLVVFSGILAFITFQGNATPLAIYILTACSAIALSFDMPARQAITPSLVEKKHLANALSLNMIMMQVATIVGPAIAGFAIAHVGIGSIYAFNAFSYIAVILALLAMRATGSIVGNPSPLAFHAMLEGLKFVRHKTIIWSTMILDFFSTFFSSATALLPIFAVEILHVGPEGLGFLYAAQAMGAMIAGFGIAHIGTVKKQGKVLLIAVAIYGIATIIFGLSKSFALSFFALFMTGVGDGVSAIIRNTIRQLETPDYIRGRMTSVNMIFFMGGPQLGEFEAGLLAAAIGGPFSVVIGGIGTLVATGTMAYLVPKLRNYSNHEAEHPTI